jgi:serpin B
MKKLIILLVSVVSLLAILGCSQPVSGAEIKSNKPRQTAPAATQNTKETLAENNSVFALALYQRVNKTAGNLFYSPYSISEALAMTYGGAKEATATQMASVLRFSLSPQNLHPAFNSIDLDLASRGQGAQGADGKGFKLNVVNAIWGQKGFKFTTEYLDLLAQNYGAGMRIVDYKNASEEARKTINQWVSDQTAAKIQDLLPQGSVTSLTRLVLTNAIYFNAAWATQFEKSQTQNAQFTMLNGTTVTVPMMRQNAKFYKYVEGSNFKALELPYDGRQLSMYILLPQAAQFNSFDTALNSVQINSIIGSMQSAAVNLTMPKFKIESELGLKKTLQELGIKNAFDPNLADFSGMDGQKDLYITDVLHKSYVTVDEVGTEAAAATGIIVGTTSMPTDIKEFNMNSPFIFIIRDNPTGSILFLGKVVDPSK